MPDLITSADLKLYLEKLPPVIATGKILVKNGIIHHIPLEIKKLGKVIARQVTVKDGPELFKFYYNGLSERPRRLFIPYPLFDRPPTSGDEISQRIADWQKEDDWSALVLVKYKKIIGLGILKRFRSEKATSAIAVRDDFLKMGLGYVLQMIINAQAKLLGLKRFHVKIISDNEASVRLHEKCGFKKTSSIPWTGYEELRDYLEKTDYEGKGRNEDRHIIEMVIELNHE